MPTTLAPQERVEAYIRDWHKAWVECGSGRTECYDDDFWNRWQKTLAASVGIHLLRGGRELDDGGFYATPPEHNPATEKVSKVTVDGVTAIVETEIPNGCPAFHEYQLVLKDDVWRITKESRFYEEEGEMGFTPSELERLLNAPSPVAPLPPVPAGTDPNCSILFQDGAVLRVEDWWNISQDGSSKINTYHLSVGEVGTLSLPSGKIVLRDFGYSLDGDVRPLARSVPPGDYPVEICVADNTCAAVRVVFNKAAQGPFSCHPALTVDHPEERGGWIGVDAANVTISDAVTFMRRTKREHARDDEKVLGEAQSRSWPNSLFFNLGTSARPNAVYIRSGHGDGAYPAYWVVNETDTTIALVVDFLVVAQWLKRTVRVNWPKGGTGIICEHSTPEGKTVSVRIDRAEESLIGTDNVELIRFLDTNGRLIGDTNRVGGGFCGNERNWNMDLSRLDEAVTSLEIVVRAGYRNGGEPRGEAAP